MLLFAVVETNSELLPTSGLMSAFKCAESMRREMVMLNDLLILINFFASLKHFYLVKHDLFRSRCGRS